MTTPFATMTMGRSGYATSLTDQGKALPPGDYVLLAVPVAEREVVREKPEALRLADLLEKPAGSSSVFRDPAAAELRRLHAEVEENDRNLGDLTDDLIKAVALLRQALEALEHVDPWLDGSGLTARDECLAAIAAIGQHLETKA